MKILLIEPDYKNKYPPLGLMKISTFHKQRGDEVLFYKGYNLELKNIIWDRIYISTLFTFHWSKTIKTIKYYLKSVENPNDLYVGGVMATLMKEKINKTYNVTVISGLLNQKGKLGLNNDETIDYVLPDYSIINTKDNTNLKYEYPTNNCYLTYATRGCIRKCSFCAVHIIEPIFSNSLSIQQQVNAIKSNFGEKKDLILMDNNILASDCFPNIINEIKTLGFQKGALLENIRNGKRIFIKRYVDFNQGIDARLLTKEKVKLLSEIAVNPLRIAFDDIRFSNIYIKKIKLAANYGIRILSNYILFNYKDTPEDFYTRLKINIELNEEFFNNKIDTRIWSFPMKYSPIKGEEAIHRKFIGKHWNKKYLRGIQCVLLATHGVVGPKKQFFDKAFGRTVKEFKRILLLPEDYIISRKESEVNGTIDILIKKIQGLTFSEKRQLYKLILKNEFKDLDTKLNNKKIIEILETYIIRNYR